MQENITSVTSMSFICTVQYIYICGYGFSFNRHLKMGSCWFSGIFHYRKDKQLCGYLFSIKEVLSFPLIPSLTNNSKVKCPNDKIQLGI